MFDPSAVVTTPADIPQMVATPAPAAAAGSVQSVWSPLLGTNPGAPVESPVPWVVLAATRRQLGRVKTAVTPAVSVSTGQVLASAVTASAVTVSPPVISSITVGTPNASTGAVVGTVTATDPGKFTLTYKATTSTKGTVSITTAGVFTYTPTATARHAAAKSGAATSITSDTVTVTVTNSQGVATTQAVTVTISPVNAFPVPKTPTIGTPNATTGVVTGTVSATDANSDPLTYSGPTTTSKGTVNVTAAGAFTYTPTAIARHAAAKNGAATAAKTDTFTVTVTDGYGGTLAVSVTVTISPSNAVPTGTVTVAKPDPVTGVASGKLTATDTDADTVTYTASKPASGSVVVNADGSFTYTPTAMARTSARSSATVKTDTFTITINDGYRGTKGITVTPTIAPSNTAPVAGTPTSTTNADTGVVTGAVNATDAEKDALTYTVGTLATAKGSVTVTAAGGFTYTPSATARHAAARNGAVAGDKIDTFTVTATDKYGAANTIPVNVTISSTNAKPVAGVPVVGTPNIDTGVVTGTVAATDANNDALTYNGSTTTTKGSVVVNANGSFTYTPTVTARHAAARNGAVAGDKADTFTVTIADGYGGSTSAVVNVTISPTNAKPVAGTPVVGTPNGSTGVVTGTVNATDANNDALTYSGSATTSKGSVVVASNGSFTYTPTSAARQQAGTNTTDAFTVTASDGYGGTAVIGDITVSVDPGTPIAGSATVGTPNTSTGTISGSAKFTDTAGRGLNYSSQSTSSAGGAIVLNIATGAFTYTPTAAQRLIATAATTDTFTVTANNGVRTATQTITVAVDAGTPIAGSATVGTANPSTGTVNGAADFADPAGRVLTYSAPATSAGGGAVNINTTTGTYTYTPTTSQRKAATATTTDTFKITANNGMHTATQTITVAVDPGTPVVGTPSVGSANPNTSVITGSAAFTDPLGQALGYTAPPKSQGGGTVTVDSGTGAFTYTPTTAQRQTARAAIGPVSDTFTVTASNGKQTATQTITVPVNPDIPVASPPNTGNPEPITGVVTGTASFTDPFGRTLTYSAPATSTGGAAISINASTGAFTYTPSGVQRLAATLATTDTFSITAANGAYTATQTVTAHVSPAPVNTVIGSISLGITLPGAASGGIIFSRDGSRAYVASGQGKVSVINTATQTVTTTISTGNGTYPRLLAINPSGTTVYVANQDDAYTNGGNIGTVSAINTATNTISATINVGSTPTALAVSPNGTRLYVASSGSGTVSVINTATNAVTNTVAIAAGSFASLAVSPDGNRLYVTNVYNGTMSMIDMTNNLLIKTITVAGGQGVSSVTVSPDSSRVYITGQIVTDNYYNLVSVVDAATNTVINSARVATLRYGGDIRTQATALSVDGTRLYVPNFSSHTVSIVDTATLNLVGTISIGESDYSVPVGVALSPDGTQLYVPAYGNTVSVAFLGSVGTPVNGSPVVGNPNANTGAVTGSAAFTDTPWPS